MTIKVTNNTIHQVEVAISKWEHGNGDFCTLDASESDEWDRREPSRGYLMMVKQIQGKAKGTYFIHHDSVCIINTDNVKDQHGKYVKKIE